MTNGWVDIKNADVILIMGSNAAENHPCGFKWAIEAKKTSNAKLVSVDPRFTRTSAVSDLYGPLRPGTDIAFLNGIIRYALTTGRFHEDYVRLHTNATYVIGEKFAFNDGLFSGFDEAQGQYDKTAWAYEADPKTKAYLVDKEMKHPHCVFQLRLRLRIGLVRPGGLVVLALRLVEAGEEAVVEGELLADHVRRVGVEADVILVEPARRQRVA